MAGSAGLTREQGKGRLHFKSPPIAEVCLGVQFDLARPLKVVELAALHSLFADRYPKTEDQPPLPPVLERFGPAEEAQWQLQVGVELPNPRCWFLTKDGDELIQVQGGQGGRFLHNWRRTSSESKYPSYHPLAKRFHGELQTFCEFLGSIDAGAFRPNQCELTYIDQMTAGQAGALHEDARRQFTFMGEAPDVAGATEREGLRNQLRYLFPSREKPVGRIHVDTVSAWRREDRLPIYRLQMTTRGAPIGDGIDGVFAFLTAAHDAVYSLFLVLTTPEIQKEWGPYYAIDAE